MPPAVINANVAGRDVIVGCVVDVGKGRWAHCGCDTSSIVCSPHPGARRGLCGCVEEQERKGKQTGL